jgi:hypothetical protein
VRVPRSNDIRGVKGGFVLIQFLVGSKNVVLHSLRMAWHACCQDHMTQPWYIVSTTETYAVSRSYAITFKHRDILKLQVHQVGLWMHVCQFTSPFMRASEVISPCTFQSAAPINQEPSLAPIHVQRRQKRRPSSACKPSWCMYACACTLT